MVSESQVSKITRTVWWMAKWTEFQKIAGCFAAFKATRKFHSTVLHTGVNIVGKQKKRNASDITAG